MRNLIEILLSRSIKKVIKRVAVCLISRDGLLLVTYPDKVIRETSFVSSAVADLDVVDKEELRLAISHWLKETTPKMSDIVFVASSSIVFTKDFAPLRRGSISQEAINTFIELVPFQRTVTSRIANKDGSVRMCVSNRDIISTVVKTFEACGFTNLGVYPELCVTSTSQDAIVKDNFIDQSRKHIDLLISPQYEQTAFKQVSNIAHKSLTQMSVAEAARQPINPFVAVAIVIIMIGVTVFVIYWQYEQNKISEMAATRKRIELLVAKQNETKNNNKEDLALTKVSAISQITPSPQSNSNNQKVVPKIQIVYSNSNQRLFDLLKSSISNTLKFEVYSQIASQDSTTTKILQGNNISSSDIDNLQKILSSVGIDGAISTKAEIENYDIVISLGPIVPKALPTEPTQVTPITTEGN
jgi:hypothetical protein